MTALKEQEFIADDITLIYDLSEKPNRTQLKSHSDRAVVAKLRADLILPSNKILTVDIDFDTDSGYHGNTMLIMDDFGVKLLAAGFKSEYGEAFADKILEAWNNKKHQDDPRKPTYMLVQKPKDERSFPRVFVACGSKDHKPDQKSPTDIL